MTPMPVKDDDTTPAAFDVVCEHLNTASFEETAKMTDDDLDILADVLNSAVVKSLVRAQVTLEDAILTPVSCDNIELMKEIAEELERSAFKNQEAKELFAIISKPHFKSLIEGHDDIAAKNYDASLDPFPSFGPHSISFDPLPQTATAIRMVGIRKSPDEPLGLTVREEGGGLLVCRIMSGSVIERQGLLHVGDIIKEINGREVNDPDQLQTLLKSSSGTVTLKVLPTTDEHMGIRQLYLKALVDYDPMRDKLIPCRDAGLAFKEGDILKVLNTDDPNWWQAQKVDSSGPSGLIPSQTLEEKRKAFVPPEHDYTTKSLFCGLVTKKKKVPTATLR